MFYKSFKEYFQRKKRMKETLLNHQHLIQPGEYIYNRTLTYIHKKDEATEQIANNILEANYNMGRYVKMIFFLIRRLFFNNRIVIPNIQKRQVKFSGSILVPCKFYSGYNDYRIFDLTNQLTCLIFHSKKDYQTTINNYNQFKDYFPMPAIINKNDEKLLIVEEYISSVPKKGWLEEDYNIILNNIFDKYYHYFQYHRTNNSYSLVKPYETLLTIGDVNKSDLQFLQLQSKIDPNLLNSNFPKVKIHGDLWAANLLLNKNSKKVFYIDWESPKYLIFFYDIFNVIWGEVYRYNNWYYLNQYLSGQFDDDLRMLFRLFDLEFQVNNRIDYLNIYFIFFYIEELQMGSKKDTKRIVWQYKQLLDMEGTSGSYTKM